MESKPIANVQAQLFYVGVDALLNILTANIQANPNFKKVTEGLDLHILISISMPESLKRADIADTYVHLHIANQQVEFDVGKEPFKAADVVIEGEWDTWKDIFTGQGDIIEFVTGGKIKIEIPRELKIDLMDILPILADSIEKSKVPPELLKLVEPS